MLTILLVIVLVLALGGGGYYYNDGQYRGYAFPGLAGVFLLLIILYALGVFR